VLYSPDELEMPNHAVTSLVQIRERLTRELENIDRDSVLAVSFSAMRAACRKSLDNIRTVEITRPIQMQSLLQKIIFMTALGELRGVFGIHIARIAASYGVDVEEQLTAIFPATEDINE
jgi:hypothetical protein